MKPTGNGMETAGVEELRCKMNVHVAEKHQDVPSVPCVGSDVQTPTAGKLLVHRDQSVVGEALLALRRTQIWVNRTTGSKQKQEPAFRRQTWTFSPKTTSRPEDLPVQNKPRWDKPVCPAERTLAWKQKDWWMTDKQQLKDCWIVSIVQNKNSWWLI